jgi:hypothetical protein
MSESIQNRWVSVSSERNLHMQDALQAEAVAMVGELEDAGDVVHAYRRDVAGRREHHLHRFQGFVG